MNRKNIAPQKWPSGMWLKTFGRVTNSRFGPLPGLTREDNETCHDGDERVEHDDPDGLARQALRLADVAAEDGERADAEAQCEERLAHRGEDNFLHAVLRDLAEVRIEVVLEADLTVRQQDGVDSQHDHQQHQSDHHPLRDALDAGLDAEVADTAAEQDDEDHAARHRHGVGEQPAEDAADRLSIEPVKGARRHLVDVVEHPARDGRVEHHEQQVARDGTVFVEMPLRPLRLEHVERHGRAADTRAPDSKLRDHDGQAEDGQEHEIDEYE